MQNFACIPNPLKMGIFNPTRQSKERCHMKLSKARMSIALAIAGAGFINTALANHFTVGGSENGNFTITGVVYFGETIGTAVKTQTFFPSSQTDTDTPADIGLPVTIGWTTDGGFTQYPCTVTMNGSVTNGVASVNSMSVVRTGGFCELMVPTNFPWRIHTLSPGDFSALLEGISYYRAGTYKCLGVAAGLDTSSGSMGLYSANQLVGCSISANMALKVTPALEIVSD